MVNMSAYLSTGHTIIKLSNIKLLTTNIIINIHDREVHVSAKSKLDCGKSKIISPVLK